MSGIDARQQAVSQSYSDMYQAAREQAVERRAAGVPTLSGGMAAQYSDLITTGEQRQFGELGRQQTQAMTDFDLQRQSALANAELEGQQATQTQFQNQQVQLDLLTQKNDLISNADLTDEQKAEQLELLGFNEEAAVLRQSRGEVLNPSDAGLFAGIGTTAAAVGVVKTIGSIKAAAAGKGLLAGIAGSSIFWPAIAIIGTLIAIDKWQEYSAGDSNAGFIKFI